MFFVQAQRTILLEIGDFLDKFKYAFDNKRYHTWNYYLRNTFGEKVFNITIPRNIRLAEAPSFGLPIMLYDEKCKGAESYLNFTKEFLERQK